MLPFSYGKVGEVWIISIQQCYGYYVYREHWKEMEFHPVVISLDRVDGTSSHIEKYLKYSQEVKASEPVTEGTRYSLDSCFEKERTNGKRKRRRKEEINRVKGGKILLSQMPHSTNQVAAL
jgi:hypothetical protein